MDFNVKSFNVRLRTIRIRELIVVIILAFVLSAVILGLLPIPDETGDIYFIIVVSLIILFFAIVLNGTKGLSSNFSNLFEENIRREIIYVFIINIVFACLFMYFASSLDIIMGINDPNWISMWDIDTVDIDSSALIFDAITAIICAPIVEELVFRGVLFNRLKIRTGIIPAMLLSSFFFGIGHEFGGMTSAFLFGICMCILYQKTDNILVPMSVHFINNLIATIMQFTPFDAITSQFPFIIPSLIMTFVGTFYLIKYIVKGINQIKKETS